MLQYFTVNTLLSENTSILLSLPTISMCRQIHRQLEKSGKHQKTFATYLKNQSEISPYKLKKTGLEDPLVVQKSKV